MINVVMETFFFVLKTLSFTTKVRNFFMVKRTFKLFGRILDRIP
jgi:hypothetical protein